jgi:hypothetical protein
VRIEWTGASTAAHDAVRSLIHSASAATAFSSPGPAANSTMTPALGLAIFIARRRSPGEPIAKAELDHAYEPDPLVAVGERMILDDARAQHRGLGDQARVELDTTKRSGRCMQS